MNHKTNIWDLSQSYLEQTEGKVNKNRYEGRLPMVAVAAMESRCWSDEASHLLYCLSVCLHWDYFYTKSLKNTHEL